MRNVYTFLAISSRDTFVVVTAFASNKLPILGSQESMLAVRQPWPTQHVQVMSAPLGLNCALTPIRCTWDCLVQEEGRFPEMHVKAVYRGTRRSKEVRASATSLSLFFKECWCTVVHPKLTVLGLDAHSWPEVAPSKSMTALLPAYLCVALSFRSAIVVVTVTLQCMLPHFKR